MTVVEPRHPAKHHSPAGNGDPTRPEWVLWAGWAAVVFSAVYLLSDVLEVIEGNFSALRLVLTYVGEAAIPLFVIGLYAAQRPRVGRFGFFGAVTYAYSYVFFASTVMYALVADSANYKALTKSFGVWMTVHGVFMLVGGLMFGLAVLRARVFPRWTGVALMVGVILVVSASGSANLARAIAEAFPAVAFAGMGVATVRRPAPDVSRPKPRAASLRLGQV